MVIETTKILIDPKFHYHPEYKMVYAKTVNALKKFPEIKTILLSAFIPKSRDDAVAYAGVAKPYPRIEFNVRRRPTNNVIYHELYHIIQIQKNPRSMRQFTTAEEIEATLLGQARMSKKEVEDNQMPYFKSVPVEKLVKYARFAAKEKARGNKNYVYATHLKVDADRKKDPKNRGWKSSGVYVAKPVKATFVDVNGKRYAKGHTPDDVLAFMKRNIKADQQFGDVLINYAYELNDFIKKPAWVASKLTPRRASRVSRKKTPV